MNDFTREQARKFYQLAVESDMDKATLKRMRESLGLDLRSYGRKSICRLCGHISVYLTWLKPSGKDGMVPDKSEPINFSYDEAETKDRYETSTCGLCIGWVTSEADPEKLRKALLKILRSRTSMIHLESMEGK